MVLICGFDMGGIAMVLLWYCCGIAVVLLWYCCGIAVVLLWYCWCGFDMAVVVTCGIAVMGL
jgi:hypothetical protein